MMSSVEIVIIVALRNPVSTRREMLFSLPEDSPARQVYDVEISLQ